MEKLFVNKRLGFNFSGEKMFFDVNQSLFSSAQIDEGTKMLLNSLRKNPKIKYNKILDLGCGYGVMGIFLKKQNSTSDVHCTDRDLLAVEFAKKNSQINNCEIKAYGSLDYEKIYDKFDLIVCNYPAKAGIEVLKKIVWEASLHLEEKGIFAIVIVKELMEDFEKILDETIKIVYREEKKGYFIFHLRYSKKLEVKKNPYVRRNTYYNLGTKKYKIQTARNVPEFDNVSYQTISMNKILEKIESKKIHLINPFQGHRAISVFHYLNPKEVKIFSRDLLSLKFTKENLENNGFKNFEIGKTYFPEESSELLVWVFDKDETLEEIKNKLEYFKKRYKNILICDKTKTILKMIKHFKLKSKKDFEYKGYQTIII